MHLKSVGYSDTVLFPTIGNAVNVPKNIGEKGRRKGKGEKEGGKRT